MDNKKAAKWYLWLWLSPILTLPTLLLLAIPFYSTYISETSGLILTLGSGAWHLVLLIPAFRSSNNFVRWHGKQMLVLAGVRTSFAFLLINQYVSGGAFVAVLLLFLIVWVWGNIWGRRQALNGVCSLASWFGVEEFEGGAAAKPRLRKAPVRNTQNLVNVIRYSNQKSKRLDALQRLHQLGMLEVMNDSSAEDSIHTLFKEE